MASLSWRSSFELSGPLFRPWVAPCLKERSGVLRKDELLLLPSSSSIYTSFQNFGFSDDAIETLGFRAASHQKAVLCNALATKIEPLYNYGATTSRIGGNTTASEFDALEVLEEQDRITSCLQVGVFNYRRPGSWVCFGGGERPKKRRVWKTKTRKGTIAKSDKFVTLINSLSNVKEEVYGALDAWIAWELEFPLIVVKKALKTLQRKLDWKRIIQVIKWMLSKGQGKTLGTYQLLFQAFEEEGRTEEAEAVWLKVFEENLECVPRAFFTRAISMYEKIGKFEKLLDVFADMEELHVKPDEKAVKIVARAYMNMGMLDKQEKVLKKYPLSTAKAGHEGEEEHETELYNGDFVIAEEVINELSQGDMSETREILPMQQPEEISKSPVAASS